MLQALGLKDKKASNDTIKKYMEEEAQRDRWREDAGAANHIVNRLDQEYMDHKQDFFLLRYSARKNMIKTACRRNEDLKEKSQEKEADRQRMKYKDKYGDDNSGAGKGGLLQQAEEYLSIMENLEETEKYKKNTEKELNEELRQMHQQVLGYKQDYRNRRECLDNLQLNYQQSKHLLPFQRYGELKRIIKLVTKAPKLAI